MLSFRRQSSVDQLTDYLRQQLIEGRWTGKMPGVNRLQAECQVNHKVVKEALGRLEEEGLLIPQGPGRSRLIRIRKQVRNPSTMRVSIVLHDQDNRDWDLILKLRGQLQEAGYSVGYAPKSLNDLRMDPARVDRMVQGTGADACILLSASRDVLELLAKQPVPTFAFFGRSRRTPHASVAADVTPAYLAVVRRLVELGHTRIVMIERAIGRKPEPNFAIRLMLEEMRALGVATGPYNVPDWNDTPQGLFACLDRLFALTPPHALLMGTPLLYHSVSHYLLERGIKAPRDVSLFCSESDPIFKWCRPEVAHLNWNRDRMLRCVINWVKSVERGRPSMRKTFIKVAFVEAQTIGPARPGP